MSTSITADGDEIRQVKIGESHTSSSQAITATAPALSYRIAADRSESRSGYARVGEGLDALPGLFLCHDQSAQEIIFIFHRPSVAAIRVTSREYLAG